MLACQVAQPYYYPGLKRSDIVLISVCTSTMIYPLSDVPLGCFYSMVNSLLSCSSAWHSFYAPIPKAQTLAVL